MTTTIRLKIDEDRVTLDDLIVLESGVASARFMRDLLARFVTDETGAYLPEDTAQQMIGKLKLSELKQVTEQLTTSLKDLQQSAVPPTTGDV